MKSIKNAAITVLSVVVFVVIVVAYMNYQHEATIARQAKENTAIAVALGKQGINNIGSPDVVRGIVPVYVTPGCKVDFTLVQKKGQPIALEQEIPVHGTSQTYVFPVDVITDSSSDSQVETNMVTIFKAHPNNTICPTAVLTAKTS